MPSARGCDWAASAWVCRLQRSDPMSTISLARNLTLLFAAWLLAGCGMPLIKDATKQATAGAMDQSLASLGDARTRQRIEDITASPEMQQVLRDIAGGATSGVTGSLTDEETVKRIARLTDAITRAAARAAVEATISEMSSAKTQRQMQELAVSTATAGTRAAMEEMSKQMSLMLVTLGPALRTTLNDDVGPGVRDAFGNPNIQAALGATAFELARQAVLGTNQGMADLEERHKKVGTLAKITSLISASWVIPVVLAIALATVIVFLLRRRAHARAHESEAPHGRTGLGHGHLMHRRRRAARRPAT